MYIRAPVSHLHIQISVFVNFSLSLSLISRLLKHFKYIHTLNTHISNTREQEIAHVFGFNGSLRSPNLWVASEGSLVFAAAAAVVVHDPISG